MSESTELYAEYPAVLDYPKRRFGRQVQELGLKLWDSPILTTWGRQPVSALRLVAGLTPVKVGANLLQIPMRVLLAKAVLWPVLGYINGGLVILLVSLILSLSYHLR